MHRATVTYDMITRNRNSIKFILDNKVVEIIFGEEGRLKPSTSVLHYLRSLPGHQGVKEGCGEGDCGACSVVMAEIDRDGSLSYRTVDSCLLFLPMLHGRQLITIENLAQNTNGHAILHPVQEAVVHHSGTQCGYCTPGVVMSIFGLYRNHRNPTDEIILDALSGNLCRCTGYQPILEAARTACAAEGSDSFRKNEPEIANMLRQINADRQTIEINSAGQRYLKPFTLAEALRLRKLYPGAVVVAGSTDVALRQTKKREQLPEILDISAVAELNYIRDEPDRFVTGSGVKLENLIQAVRQAVPALHEVLSVFGSLQIRNIATIGGNAGSASPIGDTLPLLIAMKSIIKTASADGERSMAAEEFITGYRKTALLPDELITEIIIPKPEAGVTIWSHKISKRREVDISTVSAGFSLKLQEGTVASVILAFGGMAEIPKRATRTEQFLTGRKWLRNNVEEAMTILESEFTPVSDARGGAKFRTLAAGNLLLKFYIQNP